MFFPLLSHLAQSSENSKLKFPKKTSYLYLFVQSERNEKIAQETAAYIHSLKIFICSGADGDDTAC